MYLCTPKSIGKLVSNDLGVWRSPVSAPALGAGGHKFESCYPDDQKKEVLSRAEFPFDASARSPFDKFSGCSAARLARQLRELEVAGSNPVSPTKIKTFALKGKGFLLWAYDGYSSPKVRVQEKRIPLYQAGSLIFVHPIRDSSGSEAERRNPVFPTERRDTKTFLFSFPDSDMSHGKRTAIKNCLRNSFCLCISHQGAI